MVGAWQSLVTGLLVEQHEHRRGSYSYSYETACGNKAFMPSQRDSCPLKAYSRFV
jgi:hypothetical protein